MTKDISFAIQQMGPVLTRELNKRTVSFFPEKSFALKYVWINLTYRCNLRCEMCPLWGDYGIWKALTKQKLEEELPAEKIADVLREVARFKPLVLFTGGEPLSARNWREAASFAKSLQLRLSMTTNGTALKEEAGHVVKTLDNLEISLDGTRELHDRVRAAHGTFQKAMDGLLEVARIKKQARTSMPRLGISYTINNLNYSSLSETLSFFDSLEIPEIQITFRHLDFANHEMIEEHAQVLKTEFGLENHFLSGYQYSPEKINSDTLLSEIKKIKNMRLRFIKSAGFEPDIPEHEIRDFYANPRFVPARFRRICHAPWLGITLLPDGEVWVCPGYSIGNIKHEKFSSIWNSEPVRKLRLRMSRKGLFPACRSCASLYAYGAW